ncbi:cytochrome p450 [Mycobacterium tuberculosis]|nr:cytochrome p450 [Mycobacterium tuberculosis]
MELSGYIFEQFDRAAADPRDNLLGELATACASGELDTLTAQVMMVTLFAAVVGRGQPRSSPVRGTRRVPS